MLDRMLAKEHASTGRGLPVLRTPCPVGVRVYVDTLNLLAWVPIDQARPADVEAARMEAYSDLFRVLMV